MNPLASTNMTVVNLCYQCNIAPATNDTNQVALYIIGVIITAPAKNGTPALPNPSQRHFITYKFIAFSGPMSSIVRGTELPEVKALKNPMLPTRIKNAAKKGKFAK